MRARVLRQAVAATIACAALGCTPSRTADDVATEAVAGPIRTVAEGPCPKLSLFALGERRLLVYGDTGYDLRGWLPGDELAAAQSIVELRAGQWVRDRALLEGLPTNEGGYVPAELVLGGARAEDGWLSLVTTRYAPFERGVLFERQAQGYRHTSEGWHSASGELPVDLPRQAAGLPPLDRGRVCEAAGLTFVPLASASSPEGGLFVAGQCDSLGPTKHRETTLVVAHGRAGASRWTSARLPETHDLDASVNVDIVARSDDDAYASVYEPFTPRERRHGYLARYDGGSWAPVWLEIGDGIMSLAGSTDGTLWAAGGRALYRCDDGRPFQQVPLPSLRFADARPEDLHVHTVRAYGRSELWVEASYRVEAPAEGGDGTMAIWASALFGTTVGVPPLYCDARLPAEQAIQEIGQP